MTLKKMKNAVINTTILNRNKLDCIGRILIPLIFCIGVLCSCSTIKYLPSETITQVNVVDSIAWHDSTIFHNIYHEHYKDYVGPKDTLKLETAYSEFKAWNDSISNTLKGEAVNKEDSIPVKIKWKEKIVYRDSIRVVKEPYPVEVEKIVTKHYKWAWWSLGFNLIILLLGGLKLYLKFKKI